MAVCFAGRQHQGPRRERRREPAGETAGEGGSGVRFRLPMPQRVLGCSCPGGNPALLGGAGAVGAAAEAPEGKSHGPRDWTVMNWRSWPFSFRPLQGRGCLACLAGGPCCLPWGEPGAGAFRGPTPPPPPPLLPQISMVTSLPLPASANVLDLRCNDAPAPGPSP